MGYSSHNSNQFLSYFNKIDRFLSSVLDEKKYIPYSEKVDLVIQKGEEGSHVLDQYQSKFLYFGELRNQLVHGFSLDQKHFLEVSEYAVKQIERLYSGLITPKKVGEVFLGEVYVCSTSDTLLDVIVCMRDQLNTHVPVYDNGVFVEMISESTIAYRLADQLASGDSLSVHGVCVGDVSLENTNDIYAFISQEESVYDIKQRFLRHSATKKRLGALFITQDGLQSQPILGIITAMDLDRIMQSGNLLDGTQ